MEKEFKNLSKEELLETIEDFEKEDFIETLLLLDDVIRKLQSENGNFRHCLECIRCYTSLDNVTRHAADVILIEQSSDFYNLYVSSMAAINVSCNECLG